MSISRRNFLHLSLMGAIAPSVYLHSHGIRSLFENDSTATSRFIFSAMVKQATKEQWKSAPLGSIMVKAGKLLLGTPYVGGTLEGEPEHCNVVLNGLDCVTFFESMLGFARCIKKESTTFEDLVKEVELTRYRHGKVDGYLSRLHYTSDWIKDNVAKHVVEDITSQLGGETLPNKCTFMSDNPRFYAPLQNSPQLQDAMRAIESSINSSPLLYIPKEKISAIENALKSGDIIAIATNKKGLDFAHTGMISVEDNSARFFHASLAQKKVVLDTTISEYVQSVKSHIGITVLRPLELN